MYFCSIPHAFSYIQCTDSILHTSYYNPGTNMLDQHPTQHCSYWEPRVFLWASSLLVDTILLHSAVRWVSWRKRKDVFGGGCFVTCWNIVLLNRVKEVALVELVHNFSSTRRSPNSIEKLILYRWRSASKRVVWSLGY